MVILRVAVSRCLCSLRTSSLSGEPGIREPPSTTCSNVGHLPSENTPPPVSLAGSPRTHGVAERKNPVPYVGGHGNGAGQTRIQNHTLPHSRQTGGATTIAAHIHHRTDPGGKMNAPQTPNAMSTTAPTRRQAVVTSLKCLSRNHQRPLRTPLAKFRTQLEGSSRDNRSTAILNAVGRTRAQAIAVSIRRRFRSPNPATKRVNATATSSSLGECEPERLLPRPRRSRASSLTSRRRGSRSTRFSKSSTSSQ